MSAPVVLPDGKQIAITLLAADLPDVHVTGQLPEGKALNTVLPAVRVLRIGGVAGIRGWADPAVKDNPRFSIDCFDADAAKTMRLAQRVCAAWEMLPGRTTADGIVTGISQETGPQDRPEDPNADLWRVGMTLGMSVSPPRPIS